MSGISDAFNPLKHISPYGSFYAATSQAMSIGNVTKKALGLGPQKISINTPPLAAPAPRDAAARRAMEEARRASSRTGRSSTILTDFVSRGAPAAPQRTIVGGT